VEERIIEELDFAKLQEVCARNGRLIHEQIYRNVAGARLQQHSHKNNKGHLKVESYNVK
jgi:hypothetical protein